MKAIIFNKAGKIALTKYVDGALSHVPANMCIRNGTVESIQENTSYNTTELPDGNSDWPMGEYDIGVTGNITVNLSSYQAELHAFLLGVSVEDLTDANMRVNDAEYVVPDSSPYEVELDHEPNDNMDVIVMDDDSTAFTEVESDPSSEEFSITEDTITFNSADAGKNVFVTYDWTATTAVGVGLPKTSNRPALYAVISGEAASEDESTLYDTNVIIDKCKATGDINVPQKGREPQGWSFTLKVLKPRGSNDAVDTRYSEQS
jgi:hypothetical protein